jgi:ubiquinone/menaquinone biosynthesis C-methylase UbiE
MNAPMSFSLLGSLHCPFCGGDFDRGELDQAGFGILACYCGRYPIVAGIPIIKKGNIGIAGETVDVVTSLIDAGRYRDALLAMVMPPAPASPSLAPAWLQSLPSLKGIRRMKSFAHQQRARRWREQAVALLTDPGDEVTACDFLDLYYHRSGFQTNDGYDYFALRFGQPRHLVALSFTTLIEEPTKPVLDLACGYGHITRSLARRAHRQPVIGVDQTFTGLYLAKNFIAPKAEYVCCAADGPLPFADDFFSTAFCSDAFHYFIHKLSSLNELRRVICDDGIIIMVWIHNVHVRRPHDGLPLPPQGYEALVADMPHRLVADSDVLARYLKRKGPALAVSAEMDRLSREPLLSIVASQRQDVFKNYGDFQEWPHGEGRLDLNPLYRIDKGIDSPADVQLRRTYPSDFYLDDHAQSKDYLPETVKVHSRVLTDLAEGHRTADVERLVDQFVAMSMPERYQTALKLP